MVLPRREILSWLHHQRDLFWIVFLPLSWVWAGVTRARRAWRRPELRERFPVRILSVGNIHSGGSGKTPFVEACVKALTARRCAVVSRGYGGTSSARVARVDLADPNAFLRFGEEPYLLAERTKVPVYISAMRAFGVKQALADSSPDLILLDDGFQHLRLYRDADVVLINTDKPVENNFCLPWGELREPLSALNRATALGLVRGEKGSTTAWAALLRDNAITTPTFEIVRKVSGLYSGTDPVRLAPDAKVVAFCGLGAPESFLSDLRTFVEPAATELFPDHHLYSREDVTRLERAAERVGATAWICTEKDAVKLRPFDAFHRRLLTLRIQYEIPLEFWYFLNTFIA